MTNQHNGAATLIITAMLLIATTLIVIFASQATMMQQKISANQYRNMQAYYAAEAGLEFGINYLNQNSNTILANPVGGFVNYGSADTNLTNVTLANNAKYSVVYTNPIANNYLLLNVISTGTSDDGTSTRVVRQQVYGGISSLAAAMTTKGNVTSSGNVTITGSTGIDAGGTMTQSGSNNISSVIQNDSVLNNLSTDALFLKIFGVNKAQMQAQSNFYSTTTGLVYSNLVGKNWINTNVILSGTITMGTISNPILLVVNGNFIASGSITIYGVLYVTGSTISSGTNNFYGSLISEGAIIMSGTIAAYNSSLINSFTTHNYAKIPGSWIDF
jgi:Tfp pilus assembly protein PilX